MKIVHNGLQSISIIFNVVCLFACFFVWLCPISVKTDGKVANVYNGSQWFTMIYSGLQWLQSLTMVYTCSLWFTMVYNSLQWFTMVYNGLQWFTIV